MRPIARFAFLITAVALLRPPALLDSGTSTAIGAENRDRRRRRRVALRGSGKGDAIIFVHGGMNDYTAWANQIGPFAEKYRVIAYSRRYNTTNTNKAQPSYSPLVDAEDLGARIRTLDLGKVHVVGSSFGGRVALFLALTRPELVRTLVLQEAPIMFTGDPTPEAKAQNDRAMRLALDKGDREAAIEGILDSISGGRAKFETIACGPPEVDAMDPDSLSQGRQTGSSRRAKISVLDFTSSQNSPSSEKPSRRRYLDEIAVSDRRTLGGLSQILR